MTLLLITTVALGIAFGRFILPTVLIPHLSSLAMWLLYVVLLGIGMDMGSSGSVTKKLAQIRAKALLLPVTSGAGSLLAALAVAVPLRMSAYAALAVGSGFGWYSLSSVILADLAGAELAALAFLTNVFRELIAIIFIPVLARLGFGAAAITPGGATSMDTTLAVVAQVTDEETTILSFYHGLVLSSLVPFLVALFAKRI